MLMTTGTLLVFLAVIRVAFEAIGSATLIARSRVDARSRSVANSR